jgi:hypothetical protein
MFLAAGVPGPKGGQGAPAIVLTCSRRATSSRRLTTNPASNALVALYFA